VTRIRTQKEADNESNVCNGVGYADVVDFGWRVFSFISEDFEDLTALRLSGNSDADFNPNTITESVAEHYADAGA